jgi:protein-disulfide isomerase
MKVCNFLTAGMAVLALGACNKDNQTSGGGGDAPASTVQITQANPPPGGTWADVTNATSAGGFMMGNPNAKVKLVEIGSLFCPVCKRFADEGVPTLVNDYVKTGKISWEFRPYIIHGPIDMAANLVARCNGPKTFFPIAEALYRDQSTLLGKMEATPQDKLQQLQQLPPEQEFVQFASIMGLQDWAAARGLPQAKANQCLSDQKMINNEVQLTSDVNNNYPEFKGTPSFILNGKLLPDTANWAALKPQLEAAVK